MAGTLAEKPRIIGLAAAGLWRRLSRRLRTGPIARWRFAGLSPDRVLIAPPDLRMADAHVAQEFYSGRYALAGKTVETGGLSPFQIMPPSAEWASGLHNFRWLRHMREAGTGLASVHARSLVTDWLRLHGRIIEGPTWDADTVAKRVIAWLQHSGTLLRDCDLAFYRAFLKSLAFQLRYLKAVAKGLDQAEPRLRARIALVLAALSLPVSAARLNAATRHLVHELERQILPDGTHLSRNPESVLELLTDLLPLRQTFINQSKNPPAALVAAIERLLPALRFFRHRDGSLARFNGAGFAMQERIAAVLRFDDSAGTPLASAPHGGYQRLSMGSVTLIADTGAPPPVGASDDIHAGCLSFEFSSGRHSFVVNAGVDRFGPPEFRPLARTTAAHSTATINDLSSCRFAEKGALSNLAGTPILSGPRRVPVKRQDTGHTQAFVSSHDGFVGSAGLLHEREITLSHGGSVISGRDKFVAPAGHPARSGTAVQVAIRFHIHPKVHLVINAENQFELLANRDDTWVFTCNDIAPHDEESLFFAGISGPQKTRMIVLEFDASNVSEVTWQFTRTALGAWSR
ncbi:MAG: heparinase II/III family protein [Rhizobiaceae bacterium]